jgi:hypothetical protein
VFLAYEFSAVHRGIFVFCNWPGRRTVREVISAAHRGIFVFCNWPGRRTVREIMVAAEV